MSIDVIIFQCKCKENKIKKMLFDGGHTGDYGIELCTKCFSNYDKQFLIREESI